MLVSGACTERSAVVVALGLHHNTNNATIRLSNNTQNMVPISRT